MWTGLIRRFSTEDTRLGSEADTNDDQDKDGVNGVFTPSGRRALNASPFRPPPLEPLTLHGYRDNTPSSARLLTNAIAEEIRTMVPERLRIVDDWHLVYSLEQDGASLSTLYQKCRHYEGLRVGFVLVVKDQEGGVSLHLSLLSCPSCSFFSFSPNRIMNRVVSGVMLLSGLTCAYNMSWLAKLCRPSEHISQSIFIHLLRTLAMGNAFSGKPRFSPPSPCPHQPIQRTLHEARRSRQYRRLRAGLPPHLSPYDSKHFRTAA